VGAAALLPRRPKRALPDLEFDTPSGTLGGYIARPAEAAPRPGVVVIQDSLGLSDDIKEQADHLAAAGYVAFAPDLYSGRGIRCVVATMAASRTGKGPAYEEIAAARRFLAEQPECGGRIGIIGFCMGGSFAMLCALRGEFDASSVNYGEVPKNVQRLAGACPVVGSFGARDISLRGRAQRLERALSELGVAHDVKEYPHAGHSFMNHLKAGPVPTSLIEFVGLGYKQDATEDAWQRILAFFAEHLS
jgi:carboxymethylenebutenolidase